MLRDFRRTGPAQDGVTRSDYNPSLHMEKGSPGAVIPPGVIVGRRIARLSSTKGDQ
jgi:hypothetical protein